jgi:hypothetical protein
MTDIQRAVMLIEYDDGSRAAYDITDIKDWRLTHSGLPGVGQMRVSARFNAIRQPREMARAFIDAIETLATPREEPEHEPGQ